MLQALTQRACVKNASFFLFSTAASTLDLSFSFSFSSPPPLLSLSIFPSPFSNAQVSARAHGAFYARRRFYAISCLTLAAGWGKKAAIALRFSQMSSSKSRGGWGGGEGEGWKGPFPHFARLVVRAFVSFLNSFFLSSFLCPAEPLFTLRITWPRCRLALSTAIILTRRSHDRSLVTLFGFFLRVGRIGFP